MSPDHNAMAVAMQKHGITEDDVLKACDTLRLLAIKAIVEAGDALSADTKAALQEQIDFLKPAMNALFRKHGIDSDPFVPRYAAHSIGYYHDDRGYAVVFRDERGDNVLTPVVVTPGLSEFLYSDLVPAVSLNIEMTEDEIASVARDYVSFAASAWELPNREPHVVKDDSLAELLAGLEPTARASVSSAPRV